jgi:hypothetical protein
MEQGRGGWTRTMRRINEVSWGHRVWGEIRRAYLNLQEDMLALSHYVGGYI